MKKDKKSPKEEVQKDQESKSSEIDYLDQLQRLQAEFVNYRNRVDREKVEIANRAKDAILVKLLDVKDNFDRAPKLDKGMEMIYKQFLQLFNEEEVKEMEHKKFDPHFHEAIATSVDGNSDEIVEVFQKGYLRKDKVIRPAKVIVGGKEVQTENKKNE